MAEEEEDVEDFGVRPDEVPNLDINQFCKLARSRQGAVAILNNMKRTQRERDVAQRNLDYERVKNGERRTSVVLMCLSQLVLGLGTNWLTSADDYNNEWFKAGGFYYFSRRSDNNRGALFSLSYA